MQAVIGRPGPGAPQSSPPELVLLLVELLVDVLLVELLVDELVVELPVELLLVIEAPPAPSLPVELDELDEPVEVDELVEISLEPPMTLLPQWAAPSARLAVASTTPQDDEGCIMDATIAELGAARLTMIVADARCRPGARRDVLPGTAAERRAAQGRRSAFGRGGRSTQGMRITWSSSAMGNQRSSVSGLSQASLPLGYWPKRR